MTDRGFRLVLGGMGFVLLGAFTWLCLYCSLRFVSPMKYVCDLLALLFLYAMVRLLAVMVTIVKDVWRNPI